MTTPVPWSMKKCEPICAPGMDVDAGAAVRPLGHHARDERNALAIQHVRDPLDRDGLQSGIGEDDFIGALRRGIAFVGGLDVGLQKFSHRGQAAEEFTADARGLRAVIPGVAVLVAQAAPQFRAEPLADGLHPRRRQRRQRVR